MTPVDYNDPTVSLRVVVDPRFKQRWLATRRAEGRRRLRIAIIVLSVVAFVGAGVGVLYSPLLGVRHVRVEGVGGVQATQIRSAAALGQEPLIEVEPAAVAARLDAVPWVAAASVHIQWPGTVKIAVRSRTPVAQVLVAPKTTGPVAILDATGRVLAEPSAPLQNLPFLTGVGVARLHPGQWVAGGLGPSPSTAVSGATGGLVADPPSVTAGALAMSANLPASVAGAVISISVTGNQLRAVVTSATANGPVTVLLGDQQQLGDKLTALATILEQVNLAGIGTIDLRVPFRPALTPRNAQGNLSTQAGG